MEHLANCHGEWNTILAIVSAIPFVGVWVRLKLQRLRAKVEDEC